MAREIKTNRNSTKGKMRKIKTVFSTWSQSVDVNCYTKMLNYGPNYKVQFVGQWCGSVSRAVASNTLGLRFESSHRLILQLIFVDCIKKRPGVAHLKN